MFGMVLEREKVGRKQEEELMDKRVTVQVTSREKELIKKIAKQKGYKDVSSMIRRECIYKQFNTLFGDADE